MAVLSAQPYCLYSTTKRGGQRECPPIHAEIFLTCASVPRGRRQQRGGFGIYFITCWSIEAASLKPRLRSRRESPVSQCSRPGKITMIKEKRQECRDRLKEKHSRVCSRLSCLSPGCLLLLQSRAHNSHTSKQSRAPTNSL